MVKAILLSPAVAASEAEPPQLASGVAPNGGLARKTSAGRVSVNEVPVRFEFVSLLFIVMFSVLTPPVEIVFGANPLLNEGGTTETTARVALAAEVLDIVTGNPLSTPLAVKSPASILLIRFPVVEDVTLIST